MTTIQQLRDQIDKIDTEIVKKLAQRNKLSKKIGQIKTKMRADIVDIEREHDLMNKYETLSQQHEVPENLVKQIFKLIISYSRTLQK